MTAILDIQDITKDYGEQTVLDHLSFSVGKGEVLVILGPSGCGKSTLLRCLNGLEPIQSGQVRLNGEAILEHPKQLPAVRQKLAWSFNPTTYFRI